MTVENTNPIQHFTANGISKVYSFNFLVEGKDNLVVSANEVTVDPSEYSYIEATRSIEFNTVPTVGTEITVERKTALTRTINYQTYDNSFRPQTLNYDFDRIWRVLQEKGIESAKTLSGLIKILEQLSDADRKIIEALIEQTRTNIAEDVDNVELIIEEAKQRKEQDKLYNVLQQIQNGTLGNELKNYFNTVVASQTPNVFDALDTSIVYDTVVNKSQAQINSNQVALNEDIKKYKYANFVDIRSYGAVVDKVTDNTALIRDIVKNRLGPYSVLYIPFGTEWNYSGIYNYLSDFQTIIDDSGRDKPRNVWQTGRYTWRKTNATTEATSGNTEGIAGDYHPAYFVDTYADAGTGGARASVVYRYKGIGKWQLALDFAEANKMFTIAQYGSVVYGTKSFTIGHQDDEAVAGKFGFNTGVTANTHSYTFSKYVGATSTENLSFAYRQPSTHTANFTNLWMYGNTVAFREDLKVDGTKELLTKNSKKITTTADGEYYGTLRLVKSLTASATLNQHETGAYVSNVDATTSINVTLPKAKKGYHFDISVDAAFNLRVIPNTQDKFNELDTGKFKESSVIGSKLKLVALSDNTWSVDANGTWTNQA